jgi:hypothetical protein
MPASCQLSPADSLRTGCTSADARARTVPSSSYVDGMINVKTKPQAALPVKAIRERTTFQVLSRRPRGESGGIITLTVPRAGSVSAGGNEIKSANVSARKEGRVTLEVELTPAARAAVKRHGRIRAHIKLSYVPRGGHAITKTIPLIFGWRSR